MKVAILGAGNIANSMAQAITGLDDGIEAYAVASRNLEKAQGFAEKWGFEKAYGSYEEMARDPQVDLVYVATPHSHHYRHTKLCLESGKAVLCEKAFTVNAKQARELIAISEEKKLLLAEAFWTRYMPFRKKLEDILEEGVIGKVTSLQADFGFPLTGVERLRESALAGGALLDLGVYPINMALMVLGDKIKKVTARGTMSETGVDAQEGIILEYESGQMAYLHATMLARPDGNAVINGEKGFIEVHNINDCTELGVYDVDKNHVQSYQVPPQINGYEYEILACKEALEKGKIECPQTTHKETLAMMDLLDEVRRQLGVTYPSLEYESDL